MVGGEGGGGGGWRGGGILKTSQLKIIAFFSRSNRITCLFMFSFILVGLMFPVFLVYI